MYNLTASETGQFFYNCDKIIYMKILKYLITVIVLSFFLNACTNQNNNSLSIPTPTVSDETAVLVTLILDFGDSIATHSAVKAKNAYEALQVVAKDENLTIKTKQYDFGILIESINAYSNSAEKSWIYYVNTKMGDKAADKYRLNNSDQVVWRYEKPSF